MDKEEEILMIVGASLHHNPKKKKKPRGYEHCTGSYISGPDHAPWSGSIDNAEVTLENQVSRQGWEA